MKVLAVDDNRTNLHILQAFLKKLGHQVLIAENGEDAVSRFKSEQPDLVLLDIMMPVKDGFEAAREIRQASRERWVPIILLSALSREENLVSGLDAGADDYLTKPVNFVVLEAKLRSVARTLELQQQVQDAARREQAISDNLIDALITVDEYGMVISANHATERVFGWSPRELIGEHVSLLLPPKVRQHFIAQLSSQHAFPSITLLGERREIRACRKNGELFYASVGISDVALGSQRITIALVRDISAQKHADAQLRENARLLQGYYDQTQSEQLLAAHLMEKQLHRNGLRDPRLRYLMIPAEKFSGDIVAASRSPDGKLFVLLADATGHGLPAAINVLPVLALFYRMTKQGNRMTEILQELNEQLKESIPLGRFVATAIACLDEATHEGEIWLGGIPDAMLFPPANEEVVRFRSTGLPLGIIGSRDADFQSAPFRWIPGSQLLFCSDGLLEAQSHEGKQFGLDKLLSATRNCPAASRFAAIEQALRQHVGKGQPSDDISVLLIDCQ